MIRLGTSISCGEVRVVLTRRGQVIWKASQLVGADESIAQPLERILRAAPFPRFPRVRAMAAVGPTQSQVKRLHALPAAATARHVRDIAQTNQRRFFLQREASWAAPVVCRTPTGWWAAVLDDSVIRAFEQACAHFGIASDGCMPSVVALARAHADGVVECRDAGVRVTLTVVNGEWTETTQERVRADIAPDAGVESAETGEDHEHFAEALAAARSRRTDPLVVRGPASSSVWSRRRTMVLGAACLLAAVAAVFARGTSASRLATRSERAAQDLAARTAEVVPLLDHLHRADAELRELAAFERSRRSAVDVLADLSQALPESTAIITLRLDSIGGYATLVSTSAAAVVPALGHSDAITSVQIAGALTREDLPGAQVQRLSVRFRLRPIPLLSSPGLRR